MYKNLKNKIRGRQDSVRRPERSRKPIGKGYADNGKMVGRNKSGELKQKDAENTGKKSNITEFDNMDDWMLSMILVAVMHANPDVSADEALKIGKEWVRKLYIPRSDYLWRKQAVRINRVGLRAEASKIRREMYKLI